MFSDIEARNLSLKAAEGRRGGGGGAEDEDRWRQVEEWVRTSYRLVAPKRLALLVIDEDAR